MSKLSKKIKSLLKLSSMGDGFWQKILLPSISIWLSIRSRLGIHSDLNKMVKLKMFGKPFIFYITDYFDQLVLEEIIFDEEYKMNDIVNPKIIVDIGSNVGSSIIYFRLKYPNAKIYGFEADPTLFKKLQKNVSQFSDVEVFNKAVSFQNGKLKFFIYPNGKFSSSLIERVPNQKFIDVDAISLDTFISDKGINEIDLLKFDVEGSELEIFKNFQSLKKVKKYIGELHLDLINGTKDDFEKLFTGYRLDVGRVTPNRFIFKAIL